MMMNTHYAVDRSFFFDDWSDDDSRMAAQIAGAVVFPRPPDVPSFVENEGLFRGGAWAAFEKYMQPEVGDWVLVIDCDEFIVSTQYPESRIKDVLYHLAAAATDLGLLAVDLMIQEVFGFADEKPLIRVDGLWGTIHAPRFFAYHPGGQYPPVGYGVPAVPNYVMGARWSNTVLATILHYGYAREADQVAKHARYVGQRGHSDQHVASIIDTEKTLIPWEGFVPCRP